MAVLQAYTILWATGIVFVTLPSVNLGLLSDYKLCGDSQCERPMGRVHAIRDHRGEDCRFLSFRQGDTIFVYHKLSGKREDLWAGSIDKQFGYFPKDAVQEEQVYATMEKVVETQKSDFFCLDEFGYPIDTSHLDDNDDDQKIQNQRSLTTSDTDDTKSQIPSKTEESPVSAQEADGTSTEEEMIKNADIAGSLEEASETPTALKEQGGSASWFSSSVTGWLGLAKEEETFNLAEGGNKDDSKEMQTEASAASSVIGWLGLGGDGKSDETADSLTATMTGWFGGAKETDHSAEKEQNKEEENDKEPAEIFRSRRISLEFEGSQLYEDKKKAAGTLDWLGNGLSTTLGFGSTNQESGHDTTPEREAEETAEEVEEQSASGSWLDVGIQDILGFKKSEVDESRAGPSSGSQQKEEDNISEQPTGSGNVDNIQTQPEMSDEVKTSIESKMVETPKDQTVQSEIRPSSDTNTYDDTGTSDSSKDSVLPEDAESNIDVKYVSPQTELLSISQTVNKGEDDVSDDHTEDKYVQDGERYEDMKGNDPQMTKSIGSEVEDNSRESGAGEINLERDTNQDFLTQSGISLGSDFSSGPSVGEVEVEVVQILKQTDHAEESTEQYATTSSSTSNDDHEGEGNNADSGVLYQETSHQGELGLVEGSSQEFGLSHSTDRSTEMSENASEEDTQASPTPEMTAQMQNNVDQDSVSQHLQHRAAPSVSDESYLKSAIGRVEEAKEDEKQKQVNYIKEEETQQEVIDINKEEKQKKVMDKKEEKQQEVIDIKEEEKQQEVMDENQEEKQQEVMDIKDEGTQQVKEIKEEINQWELTEEEEIKAQERLQGEEQGKQYEEEDEKEPEEKEIKEEGNQRDLKDIEAIKPQEMVQGEEQEKQGEVEEIKEEEEQEEVEELKKKMEKPKKETRGAEESKEKKQQEDVEEMKEEGNQNEGGELKEEERQDEKEELGKKQIGELEQIEEENKQQEEVVELKKEGKQEIEEKVEDVEELIEEDDKEALEEMEGEKSHFEVEMENSLHSLPHSVRDTGRPESESNEEQDESSLETVFSTLSTKTEKSQTINTQVEEEETEEEKGEMKEEGVKEKHEANVEEGRVDIGAEMSFKCSNELHLQTNQNAIVSDKDDTANRMTSIDEGENAEACIDQILADKTRMSETAVDGIERDEDGKQEEEEEEGESDNGAMVNDNSGNQNGKKIYGLLHSGESDQLSLSQTAAIKEDDQLHSNELEETSSDEISTEKETEQTHYDHKIDIEEEERETFRRMSLDLEGNQLYRDKMKETGPLDWLGNGLSSRLGFGSTNQESGQDTTPEREAEETAEEVEEQPASGSWLDVGIQDILGFKKSEVDESRAGPSSGSQQKEEDNISEQPTGSGNVDNIQTQPEMSDESKMEDTPKDQYVQSEIQPHADTNTYEDIGTSDSKDSVLPEDAESNINVKYIFSQSELLNISQTVRNGEDDVSDDHTEDKYVQDGERYEDMKGNDPQMTKSIGSEVEDNSRESGAGEFKLESDTTQDFLTQSGINLGPDFSSVGQSVGEIDTGEDTDREEREINMKHDDMLLENDHNTVGSQVIRERRMDVLVLSSGPVESQAGISEQTVLTDDHNKGTAQTGNGGAFGIFKHTFGFFGQMPVTKTEGSTKPSAPSVDSNTGESANAQASVTAERELDASQVNMQGPHTNSPVNLSPQHLQPPFTVTQTSPPSSMQTHPTDSPLQTKTHSNLYSNLLTYLSTQDMTILMELFGRHKLQFLDYTLGSSVTTTDDPVNDESILTDIEILLRYHREMLVAPSTRLADAPQEDKEKTTTLIALQKLEMLLASVKETFNKAKGSCVSDSCSTHITNKRTTSEDSSVGLDNNTPRDEWVGVNEVKDGRQSGGTRKHSRTEDWKKGEMGKRGEEDGVSHPHIEPASPQPQEGSMREILDVARQIAKESNTHVQATRELLTWLAVQVHS